MALSLAMTVNTQRKMLTPVQGGPKVNRLIKKIVLKSANRVGTWIVSPNVRKNSNLLVLKFYPRRNNIM